MGGAPQPPGPPGYGGAYGQGGGAPPLAQYGNRGSAVEVEGAGRSKAQLIVGIDFVGFMLKRQTRSTVNGILLGHDLFWCRIRIRNQHRG